MRIKREVGEKGQVVLPKDIREHLNIKPGSGIVFEVRGDEVLVFLLLLAGHPHGGVRERLKRAVLKTAVAERLPWVRILPPPPYPSPGSGLSIFEGLLTGMPSSVSDINDSGYNPRRASVPLRKRQRPHRRRVHRLVSRCTGTNRVHR